MNALYCINITNISEVFTLESSHCLLLNVENKHTKTKTKPAKQKTTSESGIKRKALYSLQSSSKWNTGFPVDGHISFRKDDER